MRLSWTLAWILDPELIFLFVDFNIHSNEKNLSSHHPIFQSNKLLLPAANLMPSKEANFPQTLLKIIS